MFCLFVPLTQLARQVLAYVPFPLRRVHSAQRFSRFRNMSVVTLAHHRPIYYTPSLLPFTGYTHPYRLLSFNLPNPHIYYDPEPIGHQHVIRPDGSMGTSEYVLYPQELELPIGPMHRMFCDRTTTRLFRVDEDIIPRTRDSYAFAPAFIHMRRTEAYELTRGVVAALAVFAHLGFTPLSTISLDDMFGPSWERQLTTSLPLWDLQMTAMSLYRHVVNTAAWLELHSRVLVWNVSYVSGRVLPRWLPQSRLVGTFIKVVEGDLDPQLAPLPSPNMHTANELDFLGVPVYLVQVVVTAIPPALDSIPAGRVSNSALWQWARGQVRNPDTEQRRVQLIHETRLQELVEGGFVQPPRHIYSRVETLEVPREPQPTTGVINPADRPLDRHTPMSTLR